MPGSLQRTDARSPAALSVVHFCDLGPVLVDQDGRVRPVGGARLESALALLLINADRRVGVDALAEAMWGSQSSPRSAATLDSHIYRLRQLLEPDRRPGEPSKALLRVTGGYRLVVTTDQVDSLRFARLAADAADLLVSGSPDRALRRTVEALASWRGRPFGDATEEPWAAAAVARLEELHGQVRETHIGALLGTGATEPALADLETALAEQPFRERLWAYRMIAFRDSGRRQEALQAYGTARAVLIEELGIEPGAELRALQAELLAGDQETLPSVRATVRGGGSRLQGAAPEPDGLADRVPPSVHLPVPRHRLIGREDELAELQGLVRSRPLVTVVGPAGCGKTRLVTEVGGRAGTVFPDGVWFVDLTVATPDRVVDTVSSTIELPVPVDGKTMLALRGFTRGRRMLLILDNCEHVLDAAAELVAELLVDGSELAILATSREPLDIGGEHVLLLHPLPATGEDSPAARLFLERLEAAPGAPADPRSRSWGAEIAAAVDGLPLAIELAAGRARAYSLAEIVTQVRADASSLSRIGRGGAAHHNTIRNAIDISYRALPDSEAALHRAVAVVPGPFTGELAAALVTPGPGDLNLDPVQIADAIAGLVHRSLLTPLGPARPAGASRFAQLATVRGHAAHQAAELLEDGQLRRDRWVEMLVRAQPPLGSRREASWYRALDDDLAAQRATLQHTLVDSPSELGIALAARLGLYWVFGGLAVEGLGWARTALAACEQDPDLGQPADRALVRLTVGGMLMMQNQPDAGREQLRIAINESRGAVGADANLLCAHLTAMTGPAYVVGDMALLDVLAAAVRELAGGDTELDVLVRHAGVVKSVIEGSSDPGFLDRFFSLYDDAREDDNHYTAWIAALSAAQVLLGAGQPIQALGWAVKAIEAVIVLGQRENPVTIEILAYALALTGDHENAVRVFALAEADHARSGMPWPRTEQTAALLAAATTALDPGTARQARSEGLALTLADLPGLVRA